jgi:hypothetical protein
VKLINVGANDRKVLLDELQKLGLDDDTYMNLIHHAGHRTSTMMNYDAATYRSGSRNILLHHKLEWMLRSYKEWKLPPGRKDVFVALAKASNLGMG